eukprot:g7182.t1
MSALATSSRQVDFGCLHGKVGISLVQSPAGYAVIGNDPAPDTPAARRGVRRGDVVLAVNGLEFARMTPPPPPPSGATGRHKMKLSVSEAAMNVIAAILRAHEPLCLTVLSPCTPALRRQYFDARWQEDQIPSAQQRRVPQQAKQAAVRAPSPTGGSFIQRIASGLDRLQLLPAGMNSGGDSAPPQVLRQAARSPRERRLSMLEKGYNNGCLQP